MRRRAKDKSELQEFLASGVLERFADSSVPGGGPGGCPRRERGFEALGKNPCQSAEEHCFAMTRIGERLSAMLRSGMSTI